MLGSHNSLTYLKSNNLLKSWAKCQEVNFEEQYNLGVRCFDVRIKFEKGQPKIVHNNVDYKGGKEVLDSLYSFMNEKKDCYLRLLLDVRKKPKDADTLVSYFNQYILYIKTQFPNIKWAEAITYWDWNRLVANKELSIYEVHASVVGEVGITKKPIDYAKKNNTYNRSYFKDVLENDNMILLIDFVNI